MGAIRHSGPIRLVRVCKILNIFLKRAEKVNFRNSFFFECKIFFVTNYDKDFCMLRARSSLFFLPR